jgi:hypothetical protein
MSAPRKSLIAVCVLVGLFEVVSAVGSLADAGVAAFIAAFAAVFLGCAWVLGRRESRAAAVVAALFLLLDGGGVAFYEKSGLLDWVVQLGFAAACLVGVLSAVALLRSHRATRAV